jgi:type I restriction enzyme S subunit
MQDRSWITCKAGDIAASVKNAVVGGPFGSNLVQTDYVPFGIPVIRGQNNGNGRWVEGEFVFVSEDKARKLSPNTARPGDLVFTQRGTLGQVAIVPPGPFDRYIVSQSQMKLTIDPDKADVLFIYYQFLTAEQQEYIRANTIQTGVPHTNLGFLRNTPLWLPLLSEQRAIAHILGTLDDKIELNRRMNETLESMARAIFKSWFVDFDPVRAKADGRQPAGMDAENAALFPDAFQDSMLGKVPRGWRVSAIGDAVRVVGGSTPSTAEPAYWEGGTISWATPKDLAALSDPVLLGTNKHITELGLKQISSGLLPVGTVLLSSRAPIGYLAISEIPVAINQGFIAMVCDRELPNYYVLKWAQTNADAIVSRANGTTFLEISKTNFRPMPVVVPPQDVLRRYVEHVELLYKGVVSNLKESRTLAALRDTLLPKLMSGEVRVKIPEFSQ